MAAYLPRCPTFLSWIPPRMHLGHWYRATRLTKTDADISVGGRLQWLSRWQLPGAASCPYDEVTNTATVVDSHWLPAQTGLYVDGYQPVPGVPRSPAGGSSLTAASQVGTWKWNPGADLWTSDASWPSASAPLDWPKDVSRHPESWAVLGQVEWGLLYENAMAASVLCVLLCGRCILVCLKKVLPSRVVVTSAGCLFNHKGTFWGQSHPIFAVHIKYNYFYLTVRKKTVLLNSLKKKR